MTTSIVALSLLLHPWNQAWSPVAQQNPSQFNDFLLLAYVAMWLVVIVYLVSLAAKQRNLHQEIQLMQRLLKEDEGDE